MPSSNNQRQRSKAGAKILKSSKGVEQGELRRLENQLEKAADIEAQLLAITKQKTNSDDNKAYKLRSHLCEVLSDVLISNPKISLERDCFQRLWRGCFYNPIRIWRQRVSREKRKRSPSLPTTQEGFQHFLSEAVTLYDFLVLQYLTKLVPCATQQDLTQQSRDTFCSTHDRSQLEDTQYASQFTTNDSVSAETAVLAGSLEGVVHGLYKLYIFLGDLHRYAEAYNKAETNYLNASKLGPGMSNPYNQLAVVAFSKDAYCVALYWYARSLLATHEKFSTSSNNLERLFASNREFLLEHGRNSSPMVFVNSAKNNGKSKNKSKNSTNNNMLRAQKAAAIKSCLTHFVDLHYDLYQQGVIDSTGENKKSTNSSISDDTEDNCEAKKLRDKMKGVIASLKSLVQASGFSDALLCKIVVINSFSLERAISATTVDSSKLTISKDFFLSLGCVLAEQVEGLLVKSLEKAKPNIPTPLVRCLLPFEMLLEFVSMRLEDYCHKHQKVNYRDDDTTSITIEFWQRVSEVGNLVRRFLKCCENNVSGREGNCGQEMPSAASIGRTFRFSPCLPKIKEYQFLKGYRPFSIVNEEYLSSKDGFLVASEAVDVLELSTAHSASQDTGIVSTMSEVGGSGIGMQENKAKLLRMLEICEHFALPTSVAPLMSENGKYLYKENSPTFENGGMGEEENSHGEGSFSDTVDEAGDVIVYHEAKDMSNSQGHQSPELSGLLVPPTSFGAIERDVEEPLQNMKMKNRDVDREVVGDKLSNPVLTSSIKPPPGFGESTTTASAEQKASAMPHSKPLIGNRSGSIRDNATTNLSGLPSPSKNDYILNRVIQGRIPLADDPSSSSFRWPQQRENSIFPISGLLPNPTETEMMYPLESRRSNLPTSMEESIRIFGDMKTTNPFVVDPPPSAFSASFDNAINDNCQNQNNNQDASIISNYVSEGAITTDDTKWLNSNLLNSLWMGESGTTKNPWAGK